MTREQLRRKATSDLLTVAIVVTVAAAFCGALAVLVLG